MEIAGRIDCSAPLDRLCDVTSASSSELPIDANKDEETSSRLELGLGLGLALRRRLGLRVMRYSL